MPRSKNKVWVTCTDIFNLFGIQKKSIVSRSIPIRPDQQGDAIQYDLYDVIELCGDLIAKRYRTADTATESQKERLERIRADSAELDLAKKMGGLVDRSKVQSAYEDRLKKIRDPLLAIPVMVKKKSPDVPPSAIQDISDIIAKALNDAHKNSDFSGLKS